MLFSFSKPTGFFKPNWVKIFVTIFLLLLYGLFFFPLIVLQLACKPLLDSFGCIPDPGTGFTIPNYFITKPYQNYTYFPHWIFYRFDYRNDIIAQPLRTLLVLVLSYVLACMLIFTVAKLKRQRKKYK